MCIRDSGAPALVYRLPGVFGKWCRPAYNSVVATFCHNIAHGQPIEAVSYTHLAFGKNSALRHTAKKTHVRQGPGAEIRSRRCV